MTENDKLEGSGDEQKKVEGDNQAEAEQGIFARLTRTTRADPLDL
jgi:hypothetical protein